MAITLSKPSLAAGELAPSVYARSDFVKWNVGCSVERNAFVNFRGGATSRGGLGFVGQAKQPGTDLPPRIIRFQYNYLQSYMLEFGEQYMRVIASGGYVTETPKNVVSITQANPAVVNITAHGFADDDWVFGADIGGMTELNGRTFVVANATADTFTLRNTFGIPIDSLQFDAYTSGGTFARIYTLETPYAAADLKWMKVTQSADVMSICCVNQETGAEYEPADLTRLAANDWTLVETEFEASIGPPTATSATPNVAGSTQYAYIITAVDQLTGQESIASNIVRATSSVDMSLTAGSIEIEWQPLDGAQYYNIYRAPAGYNNNEVPIGSLFGYIGTSYGGIFVDDNIIPDLTKTPPQHFNPFARGSVYGATRVAPGTGYTQATVSATITSSTGTGVILQPVVINGGVEAIIIVQGGENYLPTDPIVISDSGVGAGADFTSLVGPLSGTYPGVVSYFQQRRWYANSLNNPDAYNASQPGSFSFTNFDTSFPPIDTDAIAGSPWAQQVNGIQWMLPMPGGLMIMTGLDAWQLSGTGGPGSPVTPSQQSASPQESNGFSPLIQPLRVNYDFLYLQSKSTTIRDINYNFYINAFAGTDLSMLSNHLFDGYTLTSWDWANEPYKLVWAVRDDGRFLSLTFLKEQEVWAWTRHDTNGIVVSNAIASEPPVDAPYFIVKRYIRGFNQWAYYIERMNNRMWNAPEDCFCVDAGLELEQPAPDAILTASAAAGPGTITGGYIILGGSNYVSPAAILLDPLGTGSGGQVQLTVAGGEITAITILDAGQNYSPGTIVKITDAAQGAGGGQVGLFISQNINFQASAPVFGDTAAGDVIRIGGGQAVVQTIADPQNLVAALVVPIVNVIPNDPYRLPIPAPAGKWTITTPVAELSNLEHLEGMEVSVLADGAVVPGPLVVENGALELPAPASSIKVGLPFIVQVQSMPIEINGGPTVQGKKKLASQATLRMEKTRGATIGCNQPVASFQDHYAEIPWTNMQTLQENASIGMPAAALPLFTGDKSTTLKGDWFNWNGVEPAPGMLCAQQLDPLPMTVLAFMPEMDFGDSDG